MVGCQPCHYYCLLLKWRHPLRVPLPPGSAVSCHCFPARRRPVRYGHRLDLAWLHSILFGYVHVASVVGDLWHLPDDGMLDGDEFIFAHLRVYLFFALHLVGREGEGILWCIDPNILDSAIFIWLVKYVGAWVPGLLLYFQYPSLHHWPMVFDVWDDAQPIEPGIVGKNSILGHGLLFLSWLRVRYRSVVLKLFLWPGCIFLGTGCVSLYIHFFT